jgi:hypothetical protein
MRLEQTVTVERSLSLVCIPDRDTAECELTQLKRQHGPRLVQAVIRKDKLGKAGNCKTYTLRYTVKETEVRTLF